MSDNDNFRGPYIPLRFSAPRFGNTPFDRHWTYAETSEDRKRELEVLAEEIVPFIQAGDWRAYLSRALVIGNYDEMVFAVEHDFSDEPEVKPVWEFLKRYPRNERVWLLFYADMKTR